MLRLVWENDGVAMQTLPTGGFSVRDYLEDDHVAAGMP